jgi:hypothetical protein
MEPAMKAARFCVCWIGAVLALACCGIAQAAPPLPDTENGRYALSPTADGVLRIDTRSGVVSTCANNGNGWACFAVPDERAALDAEIGRLQSDNEKLRAELSQRSSVAPKTDEALPKDDALRKGDALRKPEITTKDGERKLEIPLPSDRDVDRAMGFLEQVWRRLIDMAARLQKDATGKI